MEGGVKEDGVFLVSRGGLGASATARTKVILDWFGEGWRVREECTAAILQGLSPSHSWQTSIQRPCVILRLADGRSVLGVGTDERSGTLIGNEEWLGDEDLPVSPRIDAQRNAPPFLEFSWPARRPSSPSNASLSLPPHDRNADLHHAPSHHRHRDFNPRPVSCPPALPLRPHGTPLFFSGCIVFRH